MALYINIPYAFMIKSEVTTIMNIPYSPIHTILALLILLIVPMVFHLIAFKKSIGFIHILTSILIGTFILAVIEEITGLFSFFDGRIILAMSLLISAFSGYVVNKKGIFENVTSYNVSKTSIFLVVGIVIFCFLNQKNMFPPFSPDTFSRYIPWAVIIANEHSIPAFHLVSSEYYIFYPPFLYSTIAFLFSLFSGCFDSLSAAIPILFTGFFVLLVANWGDEYGHDVPFFVLLSLLFSYQSTFRLLSCGYVLQEAPLLFFTTASFYLLFKYLRTKETIFLVLLSISSALMVLTKDSGLIISAMIFCALIIGTRERGKIYRIITIFPLLSIPSIVWHIRNFYFFRNPIYPTLQSFFKPTDIVYSIEFENAYQTIGFPVGIPVPAYQYSFPEMSVQFVIFAFPAFVFTLFYIFRNRKRYEAQFTAIFFMIFLIFMYISDWRLLVRYFYPFFGIFALFAGIEMSRFYDMIPIKVIRKKRKIIIMNILILLCIMNLLIPSIQSNFRQNIETGNYAAIVHDIDPGYLNPLEVHFQSRWLNLSDDNESGVLEYLQKNDKRKKLIVVGECSYALNWYREYGYAALSFDSISFRALSYNVNKQPFDLTQNSTFIYNNLKRMNVNYIYDSASIKCDILDELLFEKIIRDPEHFELVYDQNGYRLWEIK